MLRTPRYALACTAALVTVAMSPLPAQADGLTCGDVITKDATLTSDLTCESGTALTVAAEGVTLNLGGHSIEFEDRGLHTGVLVQATAGTDVTITGGSITAGTAIRVDGPSTRLAVTDMVIHATYGVGVDSEVTDSEFIDVSYGWTMYPLLMRGSGNLISGMSANGGDFVLAVRGDRNTITDSHLANSNGSNLFVVGDDNSVTRNIGETGMGGFGVYGNRNIVADNLIGPTTGTGLSVSGDDNLIRANSVTGGDQSIIVSGRRSRVVDNTASESYVDGILIDGPGMTVAANKAINNRAYGIRSEVATTGGGNVAYGNLAGQCLNVSCRSGSKGR